jgi:site-specific DNA-methyltransferase (adenine-specific)
MGLNNEIVARSVGAGFYHSDGWNKDFPKLQILTVEDLLAGKTVQLPPSLHTFKRAEKDQTNVSSQAGFEFE